MSFATNIQDALTRVATEFKAIRTLIGGSGTANISGLNTTDKASLVAAINEVNLKPAGGATNLDGLSDVVITTPAANHILRHNGTNFVNVDGATVYQPLDSDLTALAALTTTPYGRALLQLADQAALMTLVPASSETVAGKIEVATQAEVTTGTSDVTAVTPLKLQVQLAAFAQPLDSDLTAIAALTTTSYGRAFLALADQAALMALLAVGTTAAAGKLQLASTAEAQTGTENTKATTSLGTKAAIDQRIVNDSTLAANSTTNAPSQASVKAYADALLDANNAWTYKGVIDASTNPNYPAASAGHTYKISVAGKIGGASGPNVEVGDTATALVDASAAGTHATVGANWIIQQTNIDGAVVGPATSVAGNIASFSGTTGKVVADSGLSVDNDATMAANASTRLPTQQAVKTYAQPKDATLTALAGLTVAANQLILATGADTFTVFTTGTVGRAILADNTAAEVRTELAVHSTTEIGDVNTDFVAAFNTALL